MSTIELSANQRSVLELALDTEGRIETYPSGLQGGARTSVVRGLLRNGLVEAHDAGYRLTADGYAAIGVEAAIDADAAANGSREDQPAADAPDDAQLALVTPVSPRKPKRAERADTKLAKVVGLLTRPEGATIVQIMAETDWQQHSVRGFLAGTVKKKGYTVTNSKEGDGDRVYRILTEEAQECSAYAPARDDEEE